MKSKFLIYYCLFLFSFLPLELTGQSLELHTINVGHGDATLIILRHTDSLRLRLQRKHFSVPTDPIFLLDSVMKHKISLHKTVQKAVLIDAGVGDKQGNKIVAYMGKMGIAIGDSLEAIILTHNHKDHYGGFKMLNTGGNYKYAKIYYRGNTKPVADGPAFKNYFENVFSGKLTPVDVASTEISLGKVDTTSIVLTAVSSNGYVYKSRPKGDQINGNNQNDYGCSWILQYGAFRYFVGGDLSGENINSYKDVETPLVDSLVKYDKAQFTVYSDATKTLRKGHICAFKVDHHGSKHSTNPWFLYNMSPLVSFISCGSMHGHPNVEVIDNFINPLPYPSGMTSPNPLKNWYLTSLKKDWKDKRDSIGTAGNPGIIGGNVLLVVGDNLIQKQSRYNVHWDGELDPDVVSSSADMRKPNLPGNQIFECHQATSIHYFKQ